MSLNKLFPRYARCNYYGRIGLTNEGPCTKGEACKCVEISDKSLAFFQDRSAGTQDHMCRNCPYSDKAHQPGNKTAGHYICDNFEPLTEGRPFDQYYCGCYGWD